MRPSKIVDNNNDMVDVGDAMTIGGGDVVVHTDEGDNLCCIVGRWAEHLR